MQKLDFKINIQASAAKVWQVLWTDALYRKWTNVFHEGSYAVSDFQQGSKVLFLGPDGGGMYSEVTVCKPKEEMSFTHLGMVKDFKELPLDEETKKWSGGMERYFLTEENGTTLLHISLDSVEEFKDYFNETFPKAINTIKELAEQPILITIEAQVDAPVEKVWEFWTSPKHIMQWNNASDDWHTTKAENDVRIGGSFSSRMEAKDGSFGFDFGGVYDEVKPNEVLAYTLGDGRKVKILFSEQGNQTKITETFGAEEQNTIALQEFGWQSILNNFKKYAEANK